MAVWLSTSTTSPATDGSIQIVGAALEASECRWDRDACIGTPGRELLPDLATAAQEADVDLHPVPELREVLVV